MKHIHIPAIKKGEHSCRNCQKFTHKYSCWIYINGNGENCKMFKEKIEVIERGEREGSGEHSIEKSYPRS